MYNNSKTAKAVRLALMLGATATAAIAAPAAFADDHEKVERVQVTGSRIKRTEMEGANPVQVITAQDIKISGIDNVGDLLQEIPAVAGAATNTSINNGGSGAVRISLRGLGSQYTLVLLNGRRIVASGTGANNSVDLGNIPTAIIQRIEILKDGASAIYGSDAIGGVVNIITRNDFDGAEFNVSYDQSTHSADGETKTIDFVVGTSTDKGAVLASAFYSEQKAQWSGARDWSAFQLDMDSDGSISKGGSSATPWSRLRGITDSSVSDADGAACSDVTHGALNGPGQSDPTQFSNPTGYDCFAGKDLYNFAPANYHLTPNERYGVFVSGHYELSDSINFFTEMSYTNRTAVTKLAPLPLAPLAFFGWDAPYSADNYWNQQLGPKDTAGNSVDIADWRRRVVETGGRDSRFELNNTRAVFGFEGDLFGSDWGYEVSYIFGKNSSSTTAAGGMNFEKVALAVGPSFADADGIHCGVEGAVIDGCVPLNIFGIPGTDTEISQEMLDYVSFEAHDLGENEQQIISASVFGDLFDLPAGTVGIAIGVEHREESGADFPDALIALGITSGSSRLATAGKYEVDEVFFETTIPLLANVPGAEILELDLAVRYSDYDTFGDDTNYKVGIKWKPIEDLMVRGTVSTAFRAPSTSDLFAGVSDNSPTIEDPCAKVNTETGVTTSFCQADGVPAAGFEPIGDQLSSTRGGNDTLQPEEADTFTVGVVYNPSYLENFEITVDYWDIELTNAITTVGEQLILDNCAFKGIDCDKITRHGPDTGALYGNSSDIDDRNTNVGGVDSSGYDFNIRYNFETGMGLLKMNLDTTYYDTYDKTQADGSIVSHAGRYWDRSSGDGNFPRIKSNLHIGLFNDDWTASYTLRYIASVSETIGNFDILNDDGTATPVAGSFWTQEVFAPNPNTGVLETTNTMDIFRDVGSQVIHDIRFTYFLDQYSISLGVDNLFDDDPPYMSSGFNDNTDPRTYATQGRHISVGLSAKF
jgi:iron complex outermembrane receptor protein